MLFSYGSSNQNRNQNRRQNRNRRRGGNPSGFIFFVFLMLVIFGNRLFGAGFNVWSFLPFFFLLMVVSLIISAITQIARNASESLGTNRESIERMIQRVASNMSQSAGREVRDERDDERDEEKVKTSASPQTIANSAIRRAGNQLDSWLLTLQDIGVLAYHGDKTPDVYRNDPVSPQTTHLRPFVVIHLPYKQGRGTIRFQLYDELGEKRYDASKLYDLHEGANFVTPPTWLPLNEGRGAGRWTLRINIGEKPLAVHEFAMRESYSGNMRDYLRNDGEIDPWLSQAITDDTGESTGMSLDDLLAADSEPKTLDNRLR